MGEGVYTRFRNPAGRFATKASASRGGGLEAIEVAVRSAVSKYAEQGMKFPKLQNINSEYVSIEFTGQEAVFLALSRADGISRGISKLSSEPEVQAAIKSLYESLAEMIRSIAQDVMNELVYGGTQARYRGYIMQRMSSTSLSVEKYARLAPHIQRTNKEGRLLPKITYGHVLRERRIRHLGNLQGGFSKYETSQLAGAVGLGRPIQSQASVTENLYALSHTMGNVGANPLHLPYKMPTGQLMRAVTNGIRATTYGVFIGVNEAEFRGGEVYWMFVEQGHSVVIPLPTKHGTKMIRTGTHVAGKFFMQELVRRVQEEVAPKIEGMLQEIGPMTGRIIGEVISAGQRGSAALKASGSLGRYGGIGERSPFSSGMRGFGRLQDVGESGFDTVHATIQGGLDTGSIADLVAAYRAKFGKNPPAEWLNE
jgi:hypothetical protein